MVTKSINILNLNVPCYNRCRYCLLSYCGETLGIDYDRSVRYARAFYQWLQQNRPEINFMYYFGYSMEHSRLFEAIQFMQETNSPSGEFLQFNGMKERTAEELAFFLAQLKEWGIKRLNFTFYGAREYHDKFSARQGDYELMMKTLDMALELDFSVEVGIPVTKENINQIDELVELFSNKRVDLYIFTPHSGGRGGSLFNLKITLEDYRNMRENTKKYLNRNAHKTPSEWAKNPPKEAAYRTLTLSLLPSNIEELENQSFEETLLQLETMDEQYFSIIPSFNVLLLRYADPSDERLYSKKDLYMLYRKKFIEENGIQIKDITDERYSGSIRY